MPTVDAATFDATHVVASPSKLAQNDQTMMSAPRAARHQELLASLGHLNTIIARESRGSPLIVGKAAGAGKRADLEEAVRQLRTYGTCVTSADNDIEILPGATEKTATAAIELEAALLNKLAAFHGVTPNPDQ